jgi:hypothetical protein
MPPLKNKQAVDKKVVLSQPTHILIKAIKECYYEHLTIIFNFLIEKKSNGPVSKVFFNKSYSYYVTQSFFIENYRH